MAEIIRFPSGVRVPATTIPRAEFERLAELALDVVEHEQTYAVAANLVDRIILLLDDTDGNHNAEDGGDAESSLGGPKGHASQVGWLRGGDQDLECN